MDLTDRGERSTSRGAPRAPGRAPAQRRRNPRRRARRVAVASFVATAALALATTGCVGKTGRNDDPVAPGSDGRPRLEIPTRVEDPARP